MPVPSTACPRIPSRFFRRSLHALLLAGTLATLPAQAQAPLPAPDIAARSWFLIDVTTHTVLYSQMPDERVEPASLTKLMTAYLVFVPNECHSFCWQWRRETALNFGKWCG